MTDKIKGRLWPALRSRSQVAKLLLGSDRVLGGLGDAELHDSLGLDLDGFAGLWVASHAGFTVRLHQAAQAGHDEHAVLLGFFDSDIGQFFKKSRRSLVGEFGLLG